VSSARSCPTQRRPITRPGKFIHHLIGFLAAPILLSAFWVTSCTNSPVSSLERIQKRGELVVLTRNAPTTYYEGRDGLSGIEYEMASDFGRSLGLPVRFVVMDSIASILVALQEGRGDIAAAGLTKTRERSHSFLFGPEYQSVQQQVVCRRDGAIPRQVANLAGLRLMLIASSSYVERMGQLKTQHPGIHWETTETLDTEQLLEQVWTGQIDCTIADSNIVAINRRYYPELTVPMVISEPESLAWAMRKDSKDLRSAVAAWFKAFHRDGNMDTLEERYYGYVGRADYVDLRVFNRRVQARLPRYRALFESAAHHYEVSWTLLAAQAYQESQWNPAATSPTGVRGLMMLTQNTAAGLGIEDRLDPQQSIMGGAKYLARLYHRLNPSIEEPDRTWIALAAYNVGLSHVHDAQELARNMGKNPFLWNDLKTVLPLLAQQRYYRQLKHGYARGREPVRYVQRIRHFHDLLERTLAETSVLGSSPEVEPVKGHPFPRTEFFRAL
jgi:membrane-bound lytic murein transglycosylase F